MTIICCRDGGSPDNLVQVKSAVNMRSDLATRLESVRADFAAQAQRFEDASSKLRVTLGRLQDGQPQYDRLRECAYARLQARLETMPVIEQAKGVLMAQCHCGPDEAFDLLRRASQRSNVRVSVLARRIVNEASAGRPLPGPRVNVAS